MQPKLLVCLLSYFMSSFADCQIATPGTKKKITSIPIVIHTEAGRFRGYFYDISDTAIQVYPQLNNYHQKDTALKTFNYQSIKNVTLFRKGMISIGALFGAITGAFVAVETSKKQTGTGTFALDFTPVAIVGGGGMGTALGLLTGVFLRQRKFPIHNNKDKFQGFQLKVLKKIYGRKYVKST